ncbi:MAG: mechanosensitive ion channel [Magnetococcales bacterium]|nr:mechanosensitive ion channel [Magnetococcales bacterium]
MLRPLFFFLLCALFIHPIIAYSEIKSSRVSNSVQALEALNSVLKMQRDLENEISKTQQKIKTTTTSLEKKELQEELDKLEQQLLDTKNNFLQIATNIESPDGADENEKQFDIQEEVVALVEPIITEMKMMTARMRDKSRLKEKILNLQQALPEAKKAAQHIETLLSTSKEPSVRSSLTEIKERWRLRIERINNGLKITQFQLDKMEQEEESFTEMSKSGIKDFFRKRGRYLAGGLLVFLLIFFISKGFYSVLKKIIPGYNKVHRPFSIRLFSLLYRIVTIFLLIAGPMTVFYFAEDWVLFSLGVLILLGMAWTIRRTLPGLLQQSRLMLNIGSVREGERMEYAGLPWQIRQINLFSTLENPDAGLKLRLPLEALLGKISMPLTEDITWFPCRKGDWVILSDTTRGKVISITHDMVRLVQRGGAHKTYPMADFLSLSPENISVNFRLKETIGISYDLQANATTDILKTLKETVEHRIQNDGYGKYLLNLRVEFQSAGASSLDLVVIADFTGNQAPLYNRLRRALQRWSVDACTEHGWEIPFTQMSVHFPEKE